MKLLKFEMGEKKKSVGVSQDCLISHVFINDTCYVDVVSFFFFAGHGLLFLFLVSLQFIYVVKHLIAVKVVFFLTSTQKSQEISNYY